MESPKPGRIGRRKQLAAFENAATGGYHIGHLPVYVQEIEGWTFRRFRAASAWRSRQAAQSCG